MPERKKNSKSVARVVREGKPSKRRKKQLTKGQRIARNILGAIGKFLLTTILVLTITGCIVGTALTIYILDYVDSEPEIRLTSVGITNSSIVNAVNEEGEMETIASLSRGENKEWISISEIPDNVKNAFVYFEDQDFYEHEGVDFGRTIAAVLNEVLGIGERFGGSTITQQLIKNLNGDIYNRTIEVKIKEIMQAMNLERYHTKDQILEAYLNIIGLHYNTVGVQAGARYYFGKDVSELTLAESASLAVITKSPAHYNPIDDPEANKTRRNNCLKKMLEFECITQEEYEAACAEPVVTVKTPSLESNEEEEETDDSVGGWFTDALTAQVLEDLMERYNYTYAAAEDLLYTGGLTINSTMEIETQRKMEEIFENDANFKVGNLSADDMPQASMVIMNYDGEICGLIGGRGERTGSRLFNRATDANRAFGSTIKPLSAYSLAIEQDLVNWSTVLMDEAVFQIKDEETGYMRDWPRNYSRKYNGPMTIEEAVRISINTIPVVLVQSLDPLASYDFMRYQLGFAFETLPEGEATFDGMALGGAPCTTLELTAAYQIFGNGGEYIDPVLYTTVTDRNGKVILDNTNRTATRVISTQTSTIMNRLLRVVVTSGTGTRANSAKWEVVGKSGTSNDNKDVAFAGLTPYYVAAIRYGYDQDKDDEGNDLSIPSSIGRHDISLWKTVMESVQAGKPNATFQLNWDGVSGAQYCKETGLLASSLCVEKGYGYYKDSNMPDVCTYCDGTKKSED